MYKTTYRKRTCLKEAPAAYLLGGEYKGQRKGESKLCQTAGAKLVKR